MTLYEILARRLLLSGNGSPAMFDQVCSYVLTGKYVSSPGHDIEGDGDAIIEDGVNAPADLEQIGNILRYGPAYFGAETVSPEAGALPLLPGVGVAITWGTPPVTASFVDIEWNRNNTGWVALITLALPYFIWIGMPIQTSTYQHVRSWGNNDYAVYRFRFRSSDGTVWGWSNQKVYSRNNKTKVIPYDVNRVDYLLDNIDTL